MQPVGGLRTHCGPAAHLHTLCTALCLLWQVLHALSARAILQRLDKRKLQHELDVHRLFLLTSYHRRQGAAVPVAVERFLLLCSTAGGSALLSLVWTDPREYF